MAKIKRPWYVEEEMAYEIEAESTTSPDHKSESSLVRELISLGFKAYKRKKKDLTL